MADKKVKTFTYRKKKYEVQLGESPRLYFIKSLNVWVGIGGDYQTNASPPLITRTVPEATKKQYVEISKVSDLVNLVTKKQKNDTRAK